MPKIKEVMAKTLRRASRSSTTAYSPACLKPFFTSARLAGSMDSIPMKIHLPPAGRDQINELLIAQQIGADLGDQCTCALAAIMSRSNDFVRFTLMAKLSSMKNTAIWPPSSRARASAARVRSPRFHWYESGWSRQKTRHGAKLASVRTAAPGLHGNNSKGSPTSAHSLEQWMQYAGSKLNWSSLILSQGISG